MIPIRLDDATHRYFDPDDKEYVSVSALLEHFGFTQIDKLKAIHGEDHFRMLAAFGHEVHRITAADDQHRHVTKYDKALEPYLQGWCNWRAMAKPTFLAIEQPLASRMGFAGTPDRVALLQGTKADGSIEITDIKSGAITVAEELQTAFYQILVEENYGKPVKARYTVHLDPKYPMGFKVNPHKNKGDVNIARCMLAIYAKKRELKLL